MIDTCRCLHRGARDSKGGRIMLYAQFSCPISFVPIPLNLLGFPLKHVYPIIEFSKKYSAFYKNI